MNFFLIDESKSLFGTHIVFYVRLRRSTSHRDAISLSSSRQTSDSVWSRYQILENGRLKIGVIIFNLLFVLSVLHLKDNSVL